MSDPDATISYTEYDTTGRVTRFLRAANGATVSDVTYGYDETDQLTGAVYDDPQNNESYAYDAAGNRTGTGMVVEANNRTAADGTYQYTYDAEGNRTSRTTIATGEVTEYTWDHRNRLVKIVTRDTQGAVTRTVEYRYDPLNRRTAKTVAPAVGPANLEHILYDGQSIALRLGASGQVINRYLHGPAVDQILADEQLDESTGQIDHVY